MGWFDRLWGGGATAVEDLGTRVRDAVSRGGRVIDVRTSEEFEESHIAGATNIPLQVLAHRMGELWPRDKPVVLYCLSGARSRKAAALLKEAGFLEIVDVGPMDAWPVGTPWRA
jgi:rhodanese-related sulfurtransferase